MQVLELHQAIQQYLNRRVSLDELEKQLVPHLPYFFGEPPPEGADLVATLELVVAEYRDGILSEDELRAELCSELDAAFAPDAAPQWVSSNQPGALRVVPLPYEVGASNHTERHIFKPATQGTLRFSHIWGR